MVNSTERELTAPVMDKKSMENGAKERESDGLDAERWNEANQMILNCIWTYNNT